jgi:MFS transporter, CP family, cyanate transporter
MNAWLPATYVERGWSQSSAGALVGVLNAVSVPAGLLVAAVADHVSRRAYLLAGAVMFVGALVGVELVTDAGWGWVWAALFGFGAGTLFPLVMTLPLDVADDARSVAAFAGLMLGVGYSASAASPFALGAVRDATGSFSDALCVLVATSVALSLVCATLSRERLHARSRASTIAA